jgi:predicted nucleic acid-binding protein
LNGIFDASAILNLAHGEVLSTILQIPSLIAHMGPQVRRECGRIAPRLDALIDAGQLILLDDSDLPATSFLELLNHYGLGAGETECLAFAKLGDHIVCCDDRRARLMISGELGQNRVVGSLGLLVRAMHCHLVTSEAAFGAYEKMRRRGGFLPEISIDDLIRALDKLGPT